MYRVSKVPPAWALDALRAVRPGHRVVDPALGDDLLLTFRALRAAKVARRHFDSDRDYDQMRCVGHLRDFLECVRDCPRDLIQAIRERYPQTVTEKVFDQAVRDFARELSLKKQAALYVIRSACDPGSYSVTGDSSFRFGQPVRLHPEEILRAARLLKGVLFLSADEAMHPDYAVCVTDVRRASPDARAAAIDFAEACPWAVVVAVDKK